MNDGLTGAELSYGSEGRPPAPGIFEVMLLVAHEARIPVACCATYPCSILVALDSDRLEPEPPANVAAAAEITPGLLKADGVAAAGFGIRLASAAHNALFAAGCWPLVSAAAACGIAPPIPCARNPTG